MKMNMECENNDAYVSAILNSAEPEQESLEPCNITIDGQSQNAEIKLDSSETTEKHSAVWTTDATMTLLKLYENKLDMLETPKKKTKIWLAISEDLKEHNIDMSPDQVRWKINALTKKYKQCVDSKKFKYYKEMDKIYAHHNVDCDSFVINDYINKRRPGLNSFLQAKFRSESKAMTELRKIRLADRIESDKNQSKIKLEKQWLEYLHRQEEQKLQQDEIHGRLLKVQEEKLQLRKQQMQLNESIELKKKILMEKELNNLLEIETEKCELLKQLYSQKY